MHFGKNLFRYRDRSLGANEFSFNQFSSRKFLMTDIVDRGNRVQV